MSENAIAIVEDSSVSASALSNEIASLASGRVSVFSTIQGNDFGSKLAVIDALDNAVPLADNIGKTINLQDAVVQHIEMADDKTGELRSQPRITLIDADGTAYHVISNVVFKDLKTYFGVLGMPHTWNAPLAVAAEKGKAATGSFITLKVVRTPKK
jgi:hypothetical protein